MDNGRIREAKGCQSFLDVLDELPSVGDAQLSVEEWRSHLPDDAQVHASICAQCREALEEFSETRAGLAGLSLPGPGPWFTARVMAAISAKEQEDEVQDGFWNSVRRLAPRLVAVSTLLLVLGGTWALELRKTDLASAAHRGGDMVFDSTVAPTWYDDGISNSLEVRP